MSKKESTTTPKEQLRMINYQPLIRPCRHFEKRIKRQQYLRRLNALSCLFFP